jgi:hypothetical protein
MPANEIRLQLTSEQQKQILEATGQSVAALIFQSASDDALSHKDLESVVGGTTNLPTEQVTFDFGKIKWVYTQQNR